MCGIIGYTGSEDVKGVLLDALELLEYRGYDSAGIAVADTGRYAGRHKRKGNVTAFRYSHDHKRFTPPFENVRSHLLHHPQKFQPPLHFSSYTV